MAISEQNENTSESWVLVADIGGTNARFAAVTASTGRNFPATVTIPTDGESSFIKAVKDVVPQLGSPQLLVGMVLAVAAPVDGDVVQLTNANWVIDRSALCAAFCLSEILIINDFTALAYALPHLLPDDYVALQDEARADKGNMAVVGPGTGLGAAGLCRNARDHWFPVTGEGGHATYAVETREEWHILQGLQEVYGRVSYERVVTGQGLLTMAELLGAGDAVKTPQDVTDLAIERSCPICVQAVDIFLKGLGRVSGDIALTFNATSGVYIAGGIVPKLLNHLDLTPLLEAFLNKGRNRGRMEAIPLRLIVYPTPAFLGLRALAHEVLESD